ncbi:MAG: hypothetical protein ACM3KF_01925 [Acidobacteriota bacterium]
MMGNNSWQRLVKQMLVDDEGRLMRQFVNEQTLGAELSIRSKGQILKFRRLGYGDILTAQDLLARAERRELYRLTSHSPITLRSASRRLVELLIANRQVAPLAMLYARGVQQEFGDEFTLTST